MDIIIYVNYISMALVVLMLQPVIYLNDVTQVFGESFLRILAAIGIVDGTLSILTIIFYRLYMNKHPRVASPLEAMQGQPGAKRKGLSLWVWILILYLVLQIAFPLFFLGFMFFLNKPA
jgi:hypothetical protein